MKECVLPFSPNWFSSSVSSGNTSGLYAFGAKYVVVVLDISNADSETLPQLVGTYTEHKDRVSSVCLSPDADQMMCCSSDNTNVMLWDVRSWVTIQWHSEHTEQITCMTWSPKNTDVILTASEKGNLVVWKLKENSVRSFRIDRDCVLCMEASPHNANIVAIGYKKGVSVIVDIGKNTSQLVHRLHCNDGDVTAVAWCPRIGENFLNDDKDSRGALLATVGRKTIKVWSSYTGSQMFSRELSRTYSSMPEMPDPMSRKMWIDLHWPVSYPDSIVFTTLSGDLHVWNLRFKPTHKPQPFSYKRIPPHNKKIFNVVSAGKHRLCSFSLDRVICVWDMDSLSAICSTPSFGGHVFCLRASPVEPGYVAIGSGDSAIRVWNQGSRNCAGDVTTLVYGARSRITCVAWHPEKEGLLAFGSEDGRVGVCNVLSKRPPILSKTHHKRTVYVVCWAYPLKDDKGNLTVYSVGDGIILQHYLVDHEDTRDAVNVVHCLKDLDKDQVEESTKSELSWSFDFTCFAIGSDAGSVQMYSFPGMRLMGSIQFHTKLVNCIRWHPQATGETMHGSEYRTWVAVAGNDQFISVHDLSTVFGSRNTSDHEQQPPVLTQPVRLLVGHSKRVTDMCWSPHKDAHLVSVSYDCTAIVWNVKTSEALVCYREHDDRLMSVLWSSLDPNLIMSAGMATMLRVWNWANQPKANLSEVVEKKKKRKLLNAPSAISYEISSRSSESLECEVDEFQDLKNMLEMKKRQLMREVDSSQEREGVDEVASAAAGDGSTAPPRYSSRTSGLLSSSSSSSSPSSSRSCQQQTARSASSPTARPSCSDAAAASSSPAPGSDNNNDRMGNHHDDTVSPSSTSSLPWRRRHCNDGNSDREKEKDTGLLPPPPPPPPPHFASSAGPDANCLEGDGSDGGGRVVVNSGGGDTDGITGDLTTQEQQRLTVEDLVPPVKALLFANPTTVSTSSSSSSSSSARRAASSCSLSSSSSSSTHHLASSPPGLANNADSQARKRKPKIKSLFPVLSKEANKGKTSLQEDLLDLTRVITGQGGSGEYIEKKPHLGLYADRLGTHRCLLQESEYHLNHENMDYHLQVELWRGNVAGALQIARQRNELSDWIVAMAPLASHELWEVVCVEYAEQLEEEGHYHKAASYLLAGHRVHQAIELFRKHRLYKEAVSLARIRLSPIDPLLEDLYTEWGQSLMKDGQFEQAAKCYLAMRQIQEASKVLARRSDQSSLKTACHMTLMANEEQLGVEYAFKLFTAHLMAGEWKEAYEFVKEHNTLKAFLPLLSTHELLIEQLTALCPGVNLTQKPLTSDSFGQWGTSEGSKKKINLPDFLMNRSDTDPIIPWEPIHIGVHSFPHHVLRHWYYSLGMDMISSDLRTTCNVITHLLELQKSFADIPQSMIVMSTHLTLCFVSLLLCETSSAITHLLKAVAFLHQNELSGKLLSPFCQLVLPQGPKYLLKLQQEFNASRLVITMEGTGGDLENAGGEGHSTIKKYLSDIKEDRGISSPGSRCRQLDCLRSFYYLAVLEYFNEEFSRVRRHGEDDGMPHQSDTAVASPEDADVKGKKISSPSSPIKSSLSPTSISPSSESAKVMDMKTYSSSVDPSFDENPSSQTVGIALNSLSNSSHSKIDVTRSPNSAHDQTVLESDAKLGTQTKLLYSSSKSPTLSSSSSPYTKEKSRSYQKGKLDQKNLLYVSKGILWDVQGKREALTEALGYIHRAISQHLLTNRTMTDSSTNNAQTTSKSDLSSSPSSSLPCAKGINQTSEEDGGCHSSRLLSLSPSSTSSPSPPIPPFSSMSSIPPPPLGSNGNLNIPSARPSSQEVTSLTPETGQRTPYARSISETVSARKVSENVDVALDVFEVRQKVEQELLGIQTSTPEITSNKNRKVIWRDSKEGHSTHIEDSVSALVKKNPEGNPIPFEWVDLPVDLKYSQPYVTQALLKQEQENIAAELKQVPDVAKIPFPSLHKCTKTLLYACVSSIDLVKEEKENYLRQLKDWSMLFAVTSHGKQQVEKTFQTALQQQHQQ